MPTWNEIESEIEVRVATDGEAVSVVCDTIRAKHLRALADFRGRSAISYYSGFLQKRAPDGRSHPECAITDFDMNGLMAVTHNLSRTKGLDFILHTPGGGTEATRALVEYLYKMFGKDVVVIVPQMAMSAGTMIACAAAKIVMGKHSCLGPTDPQINGLPAMGVLHEIDRALEEIRADPLKQLVWQEVFRKFPPGFIANCERSKTGTERMVTDWLAGNMFSAYADPKTQATKVVSELMNFSGTTEHGHHFLAEKCEEMGLKIEALEADQALQEIVLSVHHSYVASFARVRTLKFIENSNGASWNVSS
jgi:ClpP class serine protease